MLTTTLSFAWAALAVFSTPASARPSSVATLSKRQTTRPERPKRQAASPALQTCADATFPNDAIQAVGPKGVSSVNATVIPHPWPDSEFDLFSTCVVQVTFNTDNGNAVTFQVFLPETRASDGSLAWNQRFMMSGNGGFNGFVPQQEMFFHMADGYAVAGTDTGHRSLDALPNGDIDYSWARDDEKQTDWAWRAMNDTVPMAKKVVELFYTVAPADYTSIYLGCSTGGRQGLKHLELSPEYFQGYVIGAPADNRSLMPLISYLQTLVKSTSAPGAGPWLNVAVAFFFLRPQVIAVCRPNSVGLIENPDACTALMRDPESWSDIVCAPGQNPANCMTEAQRDVVIQFMVGADIPDSLPNAGAVLSEGFDAGSVGGWGTYPSFINNFSDETEFSRSFLGRNITWNLADDGAEYTQAVFDWDDKFNVSPHLDSIPADLGDRKIIMYTGKRDPIIPSNHTRAIARALRTKAGGGANLRLYEVPGMDHCFNLNGDGTVQGAGAPDPAWWIGSGGINAVQGLTTNPDGSLIWTYVPASAGLAGNPRTDVIEALARWAENGTAPPNLVANGFQQGTIKSETFVADPSKAVEVAPFNF